MIAGRRLFTGVRVDNSAVPFVGAVMKFIGQEDTFEQMKRSGSLQAGFDYMQEQKERYDISWDRVKRTFSQAWDDFEITSPIASLRRSFGQFFSDLWNLERRLGGAQARAPRLLVADPARQRIAAPVAAVLSIIGVISRRGLGHQSSTSRASAASACAIRP